MSALECAMKLSKEEVKKAIEESGMQCMAVYNAFTKDAPDEQTQRMYFVVRKE